ncbi:MAG: hypothetical protein COW01_01435 [Bdellovibrionales bacterium CG12_big_fil_rev_8_21_14_0_65_38_15]|nr:MAG: hypothetical protein COW79_03170 [Bdellovibrionales bacterium CG22_combo_CG10-13_8_21_14_all_38_13]PIQ57238.1 MAG: hypothetical protein COW01_01435 [Bdellovibrionales bacterium CG12_big_fil_rev_8_21_14_0_65_38_15]PIR31472.1 MAG: hypothetical protein COV38_00380 [Bdellovibrionales bacterium CG11_big_fil_rev_8_21_14_0_20_38_13]
MAKNTDAYIQWLESELARRMQVNPLYSMRAFAKQLALSPGALSEIMGGKRKLTYKNALKICSSLGLSKIDTQNFVKLLDETKDHEKQKKTRKQKQLDDDIFSLISNWYYFAILNLADCDDFKWSATWIGKRLGITPFMAQEAIALLVRVGLIEKTKNSYKAIDDTVLSPDDIPSAAVRTYHHSVLQKAQDALEMQTIDEREITGLSLAINPKDIKLIKKDIQEFQHLLIDKYCKGKRSEVYHLELALFRLTSKK